MVRSETPPLPPQPNGLMALVELALKLIWVSFKFKLRLIEWAVLFPMLSVPVLLTLEASKQGGPSAAIAVGLGNASLKWPQ